MGWLVSSGADGFVRVMDAHALIQPQRSSGASAVSGSAVSADGGVGAEGSALDVRSSVTRFDQRTEATARKRRAASGAGTGAGEGGGVGGGVAEVGRATISTLCSHGENGVQSVQYVRWGGAGAGGGGGALLTSVIMPVAVDPAAHELSGAEVAPAA